MVIAARSQQFVPDHVAQAMLRMCAQHGTSPVLIQEALEVLAALS
jgi:hypothetical protein